MIHCFYFGDIQNVTYRSSCFSEVQWSCGTALLQQHRDKTLIFTSTSLSTISLFMSESVWKTCEGGGKKKKDKQRAVFQRRKQLLYSQLFFKSKRSCLKTCLKKSNLTTSVQLQMFLQKVRIFSSGEPKQMMKKSHALVRLSTGWNSQGERMRCSPIWGHFIRDTLVVVGPTPASP